MNYAYSEIFKLVKVANEVRLAFKNGGLAVTMSTRKLVDFFGLRIALDDVKLALQAVLLNWLTEDDRALVLEICQRVGVQGV